MAMTIRSRIRGELDKVHGATAAARLVLGTIRACLRYRVTGLASEAAFFMLLSLPPLVLGLFGGVGFVGDWLGTNAVSHVTYAIREYAARFLTEDSITPGAAPDGRRRLPRRALRPPVHRLPAGLVVRIPRPQRLRHTISIMYGQSGVRGIVRTRALSFSLYLIALVSGVLIIPLVLIGPAMLDGWLPERVRFLGLLYWPVVVAATVAALTTLFHIATPPAGAMVAGRAWGGAGAAHLGARLVRPPWVGGRIARRDVDLRSAVRAHRSAHLALRSGHCRACRRRPELGQQGGLAGREPGRLERPAGLMGAARGGASTLPS
jgi:hypothetical protein